MLLTLHPQSAPRPTTSRAERRLWEALRAGLPEGWAAWHSLRIRTRYGLEGENDFVIWVPGRGVILLEVKGGEVSCEDGHWLQNGRPLRQAPLDQVAGYLRKLLHVLAERHPEVQAELVTALCLPETAFSVPPHSSYLDGRVLGEQDLPRIGVALSALASHLFSEHSRPVRGDVPAALHELWGDTWAASLKLGTRIDSRRAELVPLDLEQLVILDVMEDNERVLFRGGPGSGKTLLAAERARRLVAQGRTPLYLCSTQALARQMRDRHRYPIYTVRELAAEALHGVGVALQGGDERAEWTPETWALAPQRAALEAAPRMSGLFDALILDEGQDFSREDWEFVKALSRGKPVWAFADPGQGFWEDRPLPLELFETKARLPRRYRCPEALATFADSYRSDGERHQAALPEDLADSLTVVLLPPGSALVTTLRALTDIALADGTRPSDIALLSLAGQTHSELCRLQHVGPHAVRRGDADDAAEHIICDTFLRFKGLERPLIIVTELDRVRSRYEVRMHTALTRAQVHCIVVASEQALANDERLRRVADNT